MKLRPLLTGLAALLTLSAVLPAAPASTHTKVSREQTFTVARPIAEAFPLFEPSGEKKWAEGWNPVFPSADDLPLHDGSVFTVEAPHPHNGGLMKSVWAVTRYEPPHLIEYRNVVIGLRATRIRVWCAATGERETRVTVRYEYTGLSAEGDGLISEITAGHYQEMITQWHDAIAAYLRRGTPATP